MHDADVRVHSTGVCVCVCRVLNAHVQCCARAQRGLEVESESVDSDSNRALVQCNNVT